MFDQKSFGKPEWKPTAENINALPDPLRRYVHDLETRADPAGELRELVLARDENEALRALVSEQSSKLGTVLGLLREVQNDSGNWLAVPLRERIDAAVEESQK